MASFICPRCLARPKSVQTILSISTRRVLTLSASTTQKAITSDVAGATNHQQSISRATPAATTQALSTASAPSPQASTTPRTPPDPAARVAASARTKQDMRHAPPATVSSVLEGTVLKGLNYFKGKEDPVALADEEYPAWLWTVLDVPKKSEMLGAGKEEQDPRIYAKSAKARRMANKRMRAKAAADPDGAMQKVPLFEQSIDLPSTAREGESARHDLQRAMRQKRKSDIKTANFLRGMR